MSIARRPRLLATWAEIEDVVRSNLDPAMFSDRYADVFTGEERWAELPAGGGATFDWDPDSTYVRAAEHYRATATPLVVLAGKEYGTGSSRDWAAKGTALLGVRAVLAESFERIHRSNLIGTGVLPLQFCEGDSVESLGLTGRETYRVHGPGGLTERDWPRRVVVRAQADGGVSVSFAAVVRVDSSTEATYLRHGGVLPYVARSLVAAGTR